MKRSLFLSVFVCLAMSLSVFAQNGATKTVTESTVPFDAFITLCSGEALPISGFWTTRTREVIDNNGGIHFNVKESVEATGNDLAGNFYELIGFTGNTSFNIQDPDNYTRTTTYSWVLRDNLNGPNRRFHNVIHVTVKNGETIVNFGRPTTNCK
ncbi:hypothetical protein AB2B38_008485 [Balneola sp. MJW-20]|uniref:hypothetical protein n=1 Tax=Gracilimonas aurantiaca TaxID=3234185 RepID=UPI003467E669